VRFRIQLNQKRKLEQNFSAPKVMQMDEAEIEK